MLHGRHPGQRGHRFSLASCSDDHQLVVRYVFRPVQIHQHMVRDPDVAQFLGQLKHIDHAPAGDGHLSLALQGDVDDPLDPVYVR